MIYVIFTFTEIVQTLEKVVIPFPPEWGREGEDYECGALLKDVRAKFF